jgi:hypothetical protein
VTCELAFAIALLCSVLALAPFAYVEWRKRETDKRLRRGYRAARRLGYLQTTGERK